MRLCFTLDESALNGEDPVEGTYRRGVLSIGRRASGKLVFRHADGTPHGGVVSVTSVRREQR